MRSLLAIYVALIGTAVGCLPQTERLKPAAVWDQLRGANPDAFTLRTTLVEAPLGDPAVGGGLWETAGRPLKHELSTLLTLNGLRVGTFRGTLPGDLDRLTRSPRAVIDATDRHFLPGKPKVVPVNGPVPRLAFRDRADLTADPAERDLTEVECGLAVTAAEAERGEVTLTVEPRLQYGDKRMHLKPTADGTGFTRDDRKPLQAYPTLAFTVTLDPKDFLVIGPAADADGTLGGGVFDVTAGDVRSRRVLVIQATRRPDAAAAGPNPGVGSGQ